ncbi:MAG TPA: peptidase M6, partial [Streptomyces sp.]
MRTLPRRFGSRRAVRLTGLACVVALVGALVPLAASGPVQADPGRRDPSSRCAVPNPNDWTGEGQTTDYQTQFQRPEGTLRAAMLFVDFPDAPAEGATDDYYDFL